ncbi:DUF3592 domain-containing protein [Streptomyces cavernicola]|uniref:DUF3592 domain-containing protein n=1 Tax=Streptomyces cavernicola TaxID=3043613 RepID=A0ABT6S6F0_9ACTN|nr:DUF3592 domain-containing protein [Streptomyces sp. B-S-A6]MDI3402911.1 hypothetical protein [Streptomyces sp. B-S-A6]
MVVLAVVTALGGLVAFLAGGYGLRRTRLMEESVQAADALVKPPQPGSDRPRMQFETADGKVVEIVSPVRRTRRRPLQGGSELRIAYDADDPREIVLLSRDRVRVDQAFMAAGAALVVLGVVLVVRAS